MGRRKKQQNNGYVVGFITAIITIFIMLFILGCVIVVIFWLTEQKTLLHFILFAAFVIALVIFGYKLFFKKKLSNSNVHNIEEYGLYNPTFDFANALGYKEALLEIRQKQKNMIKEKKAVTGNINWVVDGSAKTGGKLVNDIQKLLLRAFSRM